MNFIGSIFKNRPGKIVLYGWIYPAIGLILTIVLYYVSGCSGGVDIALKCELPLYQALVIPHPYQMYAIFYLPLTVIIYLPILVIAIMRAVRARWI